MKNICLTEFRDLYIMYLNIPHRRLVVSDNYRLVDTHPQKRVYPSTGCLLDCCPSYLHNMHCNVCSYAYDISLL